MKNKYKVGDIIQYGGYEEVKHECKIIAIWEYEGVEGVTITPTGNYGFPIDVELEALEERIVK